MALVKVRKENSDLYLNPEQIESMSWDRGHSYTHLSIKMISGDYHVFSEYNGSAYKVEKQILEYF